ncbi:MAG: hypothetical protein JWN30_2101 [Bacilli bacterium]|nr:hypothetical protein [Bacilli bacterium]
MLDQLREQALAALRELQDAAQLNSDQILVIGASSSEVLGSKIGTAGSPDAARSLVDAVFEAQRKFGFQVAFQCCEHLNRALVVELQTCKQFGLEQVAVVPVPGAGGSVAAEAFGRMQAPVVVEQIRAHAGIDIGSTLIGMHLRPVAVPVRPSVSRIGEAYVTMARTRPKLIGGSRAVYTKEQDYRPDQGSTCT